jgi:hypothetical protein
MKRNITVSKTIKKSGVFNRGRAGCEARLYEIKGYAFGTPCLNEEGEPAEMDVHRIAANDLKEVMFHMSRRETDFDIRSITLVGLIVMLSGSSYN